MLVYRPYIQKSYILDALQEMQFRPSNGFMITVCIRRTQPEKKDSATGWTGWVDARKGIFFQTKRVITTTL